ncbi:VCBS repeat-containing protein [uncultured Winogradskyella sp.]|uniref:VCBS repeat-containing protein n=1 Tax=uncultured Winogradskyella sp. TaxID=395353 RepID=UPI002604AC59|nr:VCBS repeat-containing protein [uncultured Winogradskyella sp.]
MTKVFKFHIILVVLTIFSCNSDKNLKFSVIPSSESGVTFNNVLKDTTDQNILDYLYHYNGGGVAIGDINNDGLSDLFFTSNQQENALYLNKGNLKFEDISEKASIQGHSTWNTGVSMADVNGDGFLDIYVCAVVGTNGFRGANELYINNGDLTFTEKAKDFGLDFETFSSNAFFFDYDLDGDLDLYLLNHAIHTQESFGKASTRNKRNEQSGDRLLNNDNGVFVDDSEVAGIYGGPNGYGLDVSISDFNNDGYPDLYVSNDFHEDDYYYINKGDGTFKETLKSSFAHISKFSMGSDAADINNDGFTDLMTLDMLPEDEVVLKSSAGDDDVQLQKLRTENFGYHYQYSRNMLQINSNSNTFTETALLSNVAATDWSWSTLIADYNNDGVQDIFISNGIPKRPNDLDYINYISNDQVSKKLSTTNFIDKEALAKMPSGKLENNYFEGQQDLKFNHIKDWTKQESTFSTGAAYGDLDNDGDLDIVVNNINQEATIYRNNTENNNFLAVSLNYKDKNRRGIGSKVIVYVNDTKLQRELFPQRGFQSSVEPKLYFGIHKETSIDSLKVIWPNKTEQVIANPKVNSQLDISYDKAKTQPFSSYKLKSITPIFEQADSLITPAYTHIENDYIDFNRHKLIPYKISDRGPAVAIGDFNNDGLDDIYLGSSKHIEDQIYLQTAEGFVKMKDSIFKTSALKETVSAQAVDINNDSKEELLIGVGGGEFFGKSNALTNQLLGFTESGIKTIELSKNFEDTAVVKASDFDNDGDTDFFIGNATISNDFGQIPESYILVNTNGKFSKLSLGKLGMVRDAVWTDFNNDNALDVIVVGEWMSPQFLENKGNTFKNETSKYDSNSTNGLWRAISPFDIDKDGDMDYLIGNWGTNTKFKASEAFPMLMYYSDFDNNSKAETIIATEKNSTYYPIEGLDMLSSQMSSLFKKKYNTYKSFAGQPISELLDASKLKSATVFEVHTLQSGYLENNNGVFSFQPFNNELQVAPINTFLKINTSQGDGILAAGNYKGITPFHGKLDGFKGALILGENQALMGDEIGLDFYDKVINNIKIITINNQQYLVTVVHNDKLQFYKIN